MTTWKPAILLANGRQLHSGRFTTLCVGPCVRADEEEKQRRLAEMVGSAAAAYLLE